MAFYKENEINPFSSCLPLVAQLPIFIALYYVLRDFANDATVSGGDVSFMWIIPDVRLELQRHRLGRGGDRGHLRPLAAAVNRAVGDAEHARVAAADHADPADGDGDLRLPVPGAGRAWCSTG